MKLIFSNIIIVVLLLAGCKKDQFETYDRTKDSDFFSDNIGMSNTYKVNEIIFDDFTNTSDTFNYQLLEKNESYFTDNLGRKAIRIDRFKRLSDTSKWQYINTWYAVKATDMVERIEDNKRIVKISFPITEDAVWNSNAYNMDNANTVFYGFIDQKYTMDTFNFKSALSVESTNVNNSSRERSFREIYARGIGLVFKNQVNIDKVNSQLRGYKIRFQLIKHEK